MFFDYSMFFPAVYFLVMVLTIGVAVVLAVVLIRLMLSATRALDAYTAERKLRFDLLLSDDSDS